MRLDQALLLDARTALASGPIRLFLVLEAVAGLVFLQRRGGDVAASVLLVWLAMLILAFFAWWAGRHPRAHPRPDAVPGAAARVVFASLTVGGMLAWSWAVGTTIGMLLVACGLAGWLWSALRSGGWRGAGAILGRDVRPFVPLLLLVAVPRLVLGGPAFLMATVLALPSGIGQRLLYLVGLYAPLEALRGRQDVAAVVAAVVFAGLHVPLVLGANGGDVLAALANACLLQASVGLVACLAFQRHRAPLPIGLAHALAIA